MFGRLAVGPAPLRPCRSAVSVASFRSWRSTFSVPPFHSALSVPSFRRSVLSSSFLVLRSSVLYALFVSFVEVVRRSGIEFPAFAIAFADLIAVVGSAKAIGGTHSAIERAWRAKGMTTTFITTDANGDAVMDLELADIVLSVLHDNVDEPDPLPSARF